MTESLVLHPTPHTNVTLCIAAEGDDLQHATLGVEGEAATFDNDETPPNPVVIFNVGALRQAPTSLHIVETCAHEAVHCLDRWGWCIDGRESRAYTLGWLTRMMLEFLQPHLDPSRN